MDRVALFIVIYRINNVISVLLWRLQITQAGYHPMLGLVYYSPQFKHNIISLSMMNEIGYYEQKSVIDKDRHSHLIDPKSGHQLTFTRYDGKFYSIDPFVSVPVPY